MQEEHYLLIGGVVLMLGEMMVPGFGVLGIGGMICLTAGAFFALGGGYTALAVLAAVYLLLAAVIIACCFCFPKEDKRNPLVLWDKQRNSEGYVGVSDLTSLVGERGIALTNMRPAGTISIQGKRYDGASLGDYIARGSFVTVVKVEGNKIFVDTVRA